MWLNRANYASKIYCLRFPLCFVMFTKKRIYQMLLLMLHKLEFTNFFQTGKHLSILSKNKITRKRCEIFSKLAIKTPKRRFHLKVWTYFTTSSVSTVNFELVNICWDKAITFTHLRPMFNASSIFWAERELIIHIYWLHTK